MLKYFCNVCGGEYDNMDDYLACVTKCVQSEKSKEKLEKVNAYLDDIKKTESHLKEVMDKFKKEYPDEFYMNFGTQECEENVEHKCSCDDNGGCKCKEKEETKEEKESVKAKPRSMEFYYEKDGKNEPKMTAKVNGKEVDKEAMKDLYKDSDAQYLMRLFGF